MKCEIPECTSSEAVGRMSGTGTAVCQRCAEEIVGRAAQGRSETTDEIWNLFVDDL